MDAATEKDPAPERWRWVWLGFALSALVALTYHGIRKPSPVTPSLGGIRGAPARWAGVDIVFESVRVVEVLPGGAFLGESVGSIAVFRGVPEVSSGEVFSVLAAYNPATGEFELKAARSLPRGLRVFRAVILVVSIAVLLVVIVNVHRRFYWSWRASFSRREGGTAWRTS